MAVSAMAYVGEGNFNYHGRSFYSNGVGAYCEKVFDPRFAPIKSNDLRELRNTRFDGRCDVGYAEGPFNFRGESFYANSHGAFCRYSYYHNNFREASGREAQIVFNGRYDGICRN